MTTRKKRTFENKLLPARTGLENQKLAFQRNKLRCKEIAEAHAKNAKSNVQCERIQTPGFAPVSKNGKALPPHMAAAFSAFEQLVDNPNRFPSLTQAYGKTIPHNVRRRLAQALCILSLHMDCATGRIGVTKKEGIDTITHRALMKDYAQRFGEYIAEAPWYRLIGLLQCAGLLSCRAINARINQGKEGDRVRGVACYKQFTHQFFKELKVFFHKKFQASIQSAKDKAMRQGFRFDWLSYDMLRQKLKNFVMHPRKTVLSS